MRIGEERYRMMGNVRECLGNVWEWWGMFGNGEEW